MTLLDLPHGLTERLAALYPDFRITAVEALGADTSAGTATTKAAGYSHPVKIALQHPAGAKHELVWRVAASDELGHDRRSDRAANMLLAYDDFAKIPAHLRAVDVGAISRGGDLVSLRDAGEAYLLTTYAAGTTYAEDLRAVARAGVASELDVARSAALATYLARLHVPIDDPQRYRRAIRDLVGHGEGVFGVIDAYPAALPSAPAERLHAIERKCAEWRWRLRSHEGRLVRTHGDFHPFNVLFDDGVHFTAIDASRGGCGDAADDVTAMAINYILFALDEPSAWRRGLGPLWRTFWSTYGKARSDASLLACAPPFFAWRALVVCNPRFYPDLSAFARVALLGLAESALDANHFDPAWADELFT